MNCAFCQYNDGNVYTSIPPQYKCSVDHKFHFGDYECDKEFVPVKHGRWIRDPDLNGWYHCFYRCSVCATRYPGLVDYIPYLYCPHCGAKMDKEEKDGSDD